MMARGIGVNWFLITLFGSPNTRATRIAWMLEELGQDYEYELVQPGKIQSDYPEYLDVNPAAKVPVIRDGDFRIVRVRRDHPVPWRQVPRAEACSSTRKPS